MSAARRQRVARLRRDRGAALVEAAIVLPVVILFVGGIFELGFLFRAGSVVSSGSRSGARVAAATYAKAPDKAAALDQIRLTVEKDLSAKDDSDIPLALWVYRVDPLSTSGQPEDSTDFDTCEVNCVKWTWDGTEFIDPVGAWSSPDACGQTIDQVGVFLRVRHEPVVFTLLGTKTLREYTVMRIEPRDDCTTPE